MAAVITIMMITITCGGLTTWSLLFRFFSQSIEKSYIMIEIKLFVN